MNMKSISTFFTVVAIISFSAGIQADWKGYAGSSCIPISNNADFTRTLDGTYRVNSGASFVQCPVVRDISSGGKGRVLAVRVRLTDRSNSDDGYCTFSSRSIGGTVVDSQSVAWTGTGNKTLSFGPLNANNWGSYMIRCRIPGEEGTSNRSYIRAYSVEEAS